MTPTVYNQIAQGLIDFRMLDFGKALSVAVHLSRSLALPGDVVEFGCNAGRTAALMSFLMERAKDKHLWLYDSFKGLPDNVPQDAGHHPDFIPGNLCVPESNVKDWFSILALPKPVVVAKWFSDLTPDDLPAEICFAHIDGDLYKSTVDALTRVYPRLVPGAAVVLDDYGWPDTPGVKKAVDVYLKYKPEKPVQTVTGIPGVSGAQAIFIKR